MQLPAAWVVSVVCLRRSAVFTMCAAAASAAALVAVACLPETRSASVKAADDGIRPSVSPHAGPDEEKTALLAAPQRSGLHGGDAADHESPRCACRAPGLPQAPQRAVLHVLWTPLIKRQKHIQAPGANACPAEPKRTQESLCSSGPRHSDRKPSVGGENQRSSWRQLAAIADFRAVCVVNAVGFLTVFGARSMLLPLIARDSLRLSNTAVGAYALCHAWMHDEFSIVLSLLKIPHSICSAPNGSASALACLSQQQQYGPHGELISIVSPCYAWNALKGQVSLSCFLIPRQDSCLRWSA